MAVANAYTLAHLAKISDNPLQKGIIMNLLRFTDIMTTLPFTSVEALQNVAVRWTSLPTPSFRKINAGYTPSLGDSEQVWESVYPVGGEILFDRIFDKVGNTIVNPKTQQVDMHMKALAFTLNDFFINGDHATNVDAFEGLTKRVAAMPARQSVYFAGVAGDSTSVLDPTSGAAGARAFMDKWDELWYKCDNGNVSAIYCNEGLKWGLARVLRYLQIQGGNVLDTSQDVFGRTILKFRGIPVIDVGLKKDQATEIITNTEVSNDAGTDATSVYFVSHNTNEGLMGIQLGGPLEAYDPLAGGEKEATPTNMFRYEWVLGLATFGSRGITRGRNLEAPTSWT